MFERATKMTGKTQHRYDLLLDAFDEWGWSSAFSGTVAFGLKAEVSELEAADFFAYETFKEARYYAQEHTSPEERPRSAVRPFARRFTECSGKIIGGYHSGKTLVGLVDRMLAERKRA